MPYSLFEALIVMFKRKKEGNILNLPRPQVRARLNVIGNTCGSFTTSCSRSPLGYSRRGNWTNNPKVNKSSIRAHVSCHCSIKTVSVDNGTSGSADWRPTGSSATDWMSSVGGRELGKGPQGRSGSVRLSDLLTPRKSPWAQPAASLWSFWKRWHRISDGVKIRR